MYTALNKINLLLKQNRERERSYSGEDISEFLIHQEENLIIYQVFSRFKLIKRTKRGLVNFVGDVEKQLFGVATEKDIEQFDWKLNTLSNKKQTETEITYTSVLKVIIKLIF